MAICTFRNDIMGDDIQPKLKHSWNKYSGILLAVLMFSFLSASTFAGQADENFESPAPVLISEADSTKALTANPNNWRGTLPKKNSENFSPGSRLIIFVTNIDLFPGEGANAFRAFAEDASGKRYRLAVENIQQLPRQNWIYALTIHFYDQNGYNGQPPAQQELSIEVAWRGNISNPVRLNSDRASVKLPPRKRDVPTPAPTKTPAKPEIQSSAGDRKRFMEQAAFGPSDKLDFRLRRVGLRRWIEEQFQTSYPTFPYPNFPLKPFDGVLGCGGTFGSSGDADICLRNHYWIYNNQKWLVQEALHGEDQLRRRVSWALHQIWVVSALTIHQQRWQQEYIEILDRNAFGNYRDLMEEMTLSPAMGEYLDMVRSTRQNPNENYPRELLQLFTIGLYMLNHDGTLQLDSQGNRIPTYDQDKIDQFTKVFTGWTLCNSGNNPACPNAVVGAPNFIDPMVLTPGNHDLSAKTLFNYPGAPHPAIETCSNCTTDEARRAYANESLEKTLDNIFYHPNVGPFVGKLLIQHFVTSDPSPAYVGRVAAAFNNNGAGVRGDMKSVIRAVLLDPEARGSRKTDPTYGKLREPLQHFTNILRTFNVRAAAHSEGVPATPPASCQNMSDGVVDWLMSDMGQNLWAPPSVFSYFSPDYVVPGTDILGPEYGLANTGSSFYRNNVTFVFTFLLGINFDKQTAANPNPYIPCGTSIDRSEATAQAAADPTGNRLIEWLNTKMMHGTMSEAMKSKIREAINFNVSPDLKAGQAIYLVASSSQYQVQR